MQKDFPVFYYESIDSTNSKARELALGGAAHGTIVVAEQQTSGRGRAGKVWSSPYGKNLYFTLILRPEFSLDKASMLTILMADAVYSGILQELERSRQAGSKRDLEEHAGTNRNLLNSDKAEGQLMSGIKWPNDIVLNGKKICGILTELFLKADDCGNDYIVIGVGVNVKNQDFSEDIKYKASSIQQETNQCLSRKTLLQSIMQNFWKRYDCFLKTTSLEFLREDYNTRLVNCNRQVNILDPKGNYQGIALGICDTGELIVELPDGSQTLVNAGEVSVRGLYGYV